MKKIIATFLISSSLIFANDNSIGLDTIVGATLGVALGNQIGKGNGRDVAKIAGGLLGASIANSSRTPSYESYNDNYYDNNYNSRVYAKPSNNYYYNNNYYNNRPNDGYYNGYDRRQAPQVTVIYQDNDRYYPREQHYRSNHHRDEYREVYGHGR